MMLKPNNIHKIVEKVDSMYSIFFGSLLIFSAFFMIITNELQSINEPITVCVEKTLSSGVISRECSPQTTSEVTDTTSKWTTRIAGFILMLVAATIMQVPLTQHISRIPYMNTLLSKDSTYTILILGLGLTMISIFIGFIFLYVPFIGYIVAGLFAYGYFHVMQRMGRSTSGVAKVVYVVMILVALLILLTIFAFFYLTREG